MKEKPKPIRRPQFGPVQIFRVPSDGPIIPRLQKQQSAQAIGFTANWPTEDSDDD